MGIGTRLALIITILVLSIGFVGVRATNNADLTFSTLVNDVVATQESLVDLRYSANLYNTSISELGVLYALGAEEDEIREVEQEIEASSQNMLFDLQIFNGLILTYSPEKLGEVEELGTNLLDFLSAGDRYMVALQSDLVDEELLEAREDFEVFEHGFDVQLTELIEVEATEVQTIYIQLQDSLRSATLHEIGATVMCIVIAIGAAVMMTRSIINPIRQLQKSASRIAEGDYHQSVNISSKSEIGQLAEAFNQMSQTILKRDSELTQAAQALEKQVVESETAREQAERSDQVKSAFLASMSHELRTPLNSVINYTKFVIKGVMGPVNERQTETLTKVADSGKHLLNLINDVLDISKIESGSLNLFVEDNVDIGEIMRSMQSMSEVLLEGKPVKVELEMPNNLPLMKADKQRIRQIILNLVSNACKFTETGHIRLRVAQQGDGILIAVEDTGPGIREEDRAAVFEPFKQTETGLRQGQGTGLGMPISKSLAEAHGGRLWFQSDPGNGTTFYVALPTKSEQLVAIVG
jgi:signal transduction histidine kinase